MTDSESVWIYAFDGRRDGPVSARQIATLISSDRVPTSTLVWKPGMTEWAVAINVPAIGRYCAPPLPDTSSAGAVERRKEDKGRGGPDTLAEDPASMRRPAPEIPQNLSLQIPTADRADPNDTLAVEAPQPYQAERDLRLPFRTRFGKHVMVWWATLFVLVLIRWASSLPSTAMAALVARQKLEDPLMSLAQLAGSLIGVLVLAVVPGLVSASLAQMASTK